MTSPVSSGAVGDGPVDVGGISLRMFAKDGETSFLAQHPTWMFASSVQKTRLLEICWHIHLPFHSSSITLTFRTSPRKMKREQSLLSNSVTASIVSAFGCLFRVCRNSSW